MYKGNSFRAKKELAFLRVVVVFDIRYKEWKFDILL